MTLSAEFLPAWIFRSLDLPNHVTNLEKQKGELKWCFFVVLEPLEWICIWDFLVASHKNWFFFLKAARFMQSLMPRHWAFGKEANDNLQK